MPDHATTARTARESLARGLSALQSDPKVPPHLLELAAPIAQAMGALHQIERSGGATLVPHAEVALNCMRTALSQLQAEPPNNPAIAAALEAVASSLGLVHSLGQAAQVARAPGPPAQAARPPAPVLAGAAYAATQVAPAMAAARPAPLAAAANQSSPSQKPPAPPMPGGEVPVINADLGTQSPTNFYKGLSGNDIIDHGGLFVSTYMIPRIGAPVRLKVSLPGGYEFEANAVVRWCREQSDAGGDAPPGFGAQFTQIANEARQLVYRYVRNREPLFHDDL